MHRCGRRPTRHDRAGAIAETEDLREFLEECAAAILECVARLPRPEAEMEAAKIATAYARSKGHPRTRRPDRRVSIPLPAGPTVADWQAYAERYHSPGCAVTPIAGRPKPRAPVLLG